MDTFSKGFVVGSLVVLGIIFLVEWIHVCFEARAKKEKQEAIEEGERKLHYHQTETIYNSIKKTKGVGRR